MLFLEASDKKYYGIYNDEIKYVILRGEFPPHRWVAFDTDMERVCEPNKYRHDLFEELEDTFYASNNSPII